MWKERVSIPMKQDSSKIPCNCHHQTLPTMDHHVICKLTRCHCTSHFFTLASLKPQSKELFHGLVASMMLMVHRIVTFISLNGHPCRVTDRVKCLIKQPLSGTYTDKYRYNQWSRYYIYMSATTIQ